MTIRTNLHSSTLTLALLCLFVTNTGIVAKEKAPLRILKITYQGKCVKKGGVIIVKLNKKITRAFNRVTITGKKVHFHTSIKKWGFKSDEILVEVPEGPSLRKGKRYGVVIEKRLPHKVVSNRKKIRMCWKN